MYAPAAIATPLIESSDPSKPVAPINDEPPKPWRGREVRTREIGPSWCGIFCAGYILLGGALIGSTYFEKVKITALIGALLVLWIVFNSVAAGGACCYFQVTRVNAQKASTPEENL